jgi:hypothetical protein
MTYGGSGTMSRCHCTIFFTINKKLVGGLPKAGYWDPINLAAGKDDQTLAYYRSAELKHGRVAMVASLGVIFQGLNTGITYLFAVTDLL